MDFEVTATVKIKIHNAESESDAIKKTMCKVNQNYGISYQETVKVENKNK